MLGDERDTNSTPAPTGRQREQTDDLPRNQYDTKSIKRSGVACATPRPHGKPAVYCPSNEQRGVQNVKQGILLQRPQGANVLNMCVTLSDMLDISLSRW
jgi:hypothetical protein